MIALSGANRGPSIKTHAKEQSDRSWAVAADRLEKEPQPSTQRNISSN